IAAAMARLGAKVALAAPVSDDPVGRFVISKLATFGIEHLTPDPVKGEARTSLALAELVDQGSETVIYRNNAADFELGGEALTRNAGRAALTVVTGTALAREPSRSAALAALESADFGVLDLDYRPYSWADMSSAALVYGAAAERADLVIGNDEEFAVLSGQSAPRAHAAALGKAAFFKEGAAGCTAFMPGAEPVFVPAFAVKALKPFGAGDAFLGASLTALLEGWPLRQAMVRGAAAAALVVTRPGCASAMPGAHEIETFQRDQEAPDAYPPV
ncbi:MAG: PfkB family carbohydrate kinase, partial [Pseudomonadota bacterium]